MIGRSDRESWAVAVGVLACIALVSGLIVESWREEGRRAPAPTPQFFAVALA